MKRGPVAHLIQSLRDQVRVLVNLEEQGQKLRFEEEPTKRLLGLILRCLLHDTKRIILDDDDCALLLFAPEYVLLGTDVNLITYLLCNGMLVAFAKKMVEDVATATRYFSQDSIFRSLTLFEDFSSAVSPLDKIISTPV